jgi:hypothetical protein
MEPVAPSAASWRSAEAFQRELPLRTPSPPSCSAVAAGGVGQVVVVGTAVVVVAGVLVVVAGVLVVGVVVPPGDVEPPPGPPGEPGPLGSADPAPPGSPPDAGPPDELWIPFPASSRLESLLDPRKDRAMAAAMATTVMIRAVSASDAPDSEAR